MMAFHKVFVRSWRRASHVNAEEDSEASDFTETEKLGIDSAEAWHRRERRRDLKGLQWLERCTSFFKGMLFLFLSSMVTALHFYFFKYGHTSPYGTVPSLLFDLCDDSRSRPASIVAELLRLLQPSADWGVLEMRFGPFSSWPRHWKKMAHDMIFALVGGLKARLIDPFKKPPFTTWVRFADPKISDYERRLTADHLFDADEKTLDSSSLKIRKLSGSAINLLNDPFWSSFLFHAANKIPLSSAFVECMFASFRNWMRLTTKPMTIAGLQARYIPFAFTTANDRKRERMKCTKEKQPASVPNGYLREASLGKRVHGMSSLGQKWRPGKPTATQLEKQFLQRKKAITRCRLVRRPRVRLRPPG